MFIEGNYTAYIKYIFAITAPIVSVIGNGQNTTVKILKHCDKCDLQLAFKRNTAITLQNLRITDTTANILNVYAGGINIESCTFQYCNSVKIAYMAKVNDDRLLYIYGQ